MSLAVEQLPAACPLDDELARGEGCSLADAVLLLPQPRPMP